MAFWAPGPFSRFLGLFPAFSRLLRLLDPFPAFSGLKLGFWAFFAGPRGLFWASSGPFLGLGPFSGPFVSFWAFFQPFLGTFSGPLWASGPLPSLFWPRGLFWAFFFFFRGLFWAFCGLLGLFPAVSGLGASSVPFVGFGPLPNLFWLQGPFLGLLWAFSGPFVGFYSRPLPGLFCAFCGLLGLFPASRSFFWAFCGLLGLLPVFSGLGAFSGPGPLPSLFWPQGLFWAFCGL